MLVVADMTCERNEKERREKRGIENRKKDRKAGQVTITITAIKVR